MYCAVLQETLLGNSSPQGLLSPEELSTGGGDLGSRRGSAVHIPWALDTSAVMPLTVLHLQKEVVGTDAPMTPPCSEVWICAFQKDDGKSQAQSSPWVWWR